MSEDLEINKEQNNNDTFDEYGVINPDSCIQYQECNLENMKALLVELFGQEITNESNLQKLCSDDVNKLDVIKSGISQRFGACITIEDIVKSNNISEFTNFVINVINSPKFPVSEKELRRNQLTDIANNKDLNSFWGKLVKASDKLQESKDNIKKMESPINLIGHHTKSELLNSILDFFDNKTTKKELKNVVLKLDENTDAAINELGKAIECTNIWIDEICKMLIWIIQIENDIYGLTEESSAETLRLSKLLSQEGVNIEGLTEVAAMEQSKRQRMHQKIKEFKADIEGKIEFLNNVHQVLLSKFEEQKKDINTVLVSVKTEQSRFFESVKSEYEREFKRIDEEVASFKKDQLMFLESVKSEYERRFSKIDEEISSFKKEQSNVMEQARKRAIIYKVISCVACAVSIVSLVLTII